MPRYPDAGLFVTGTDTGVGKTYVATMIVRELVAAGYRVGVYKPAASGCDASQGMTVSDDALLLWQAAGSPGKLREVCPQTFAAPIAPHLAAIAEGKQLDARLMRDGLAAWHARCDVVVVEGSGGLLSPLGASECVADLAAEFGYPLVIVAGNALGVINQALQTVHVARTYRGGIPIAGVVLNTPRPPSGEDPSRATNRSELEARLTVPLLSEVSYEADRFDREVDWKNLARR